MSMRDSLRSWIRTKPRLKKLALLAMRTGVALTPRGLLQLPRFLTHWKRFRSAGGTAATIDLYPMLFDRAPAYHDPQYFHQGVWGTKRILAAAPKHHVDVGSHIPWVGILTAFTDVTFVDIRPTILALPRLDTKVGTIVDLPFETASLHSLSSLHVIEHIGLGRYGDPIDPNGAQLAATELQRVLAPGGRLYLSTPVGRRRTLFNSQRVFDVEDILGLFDQCTLVELSIVDAESTVHENLTLSEARVRLGERDGLGMYVFAKR